jgi:carbonic anhydrase/acetyltransferase-like protein (isoleucine patch superfamily)
MTQISPENIRSHQSKRPTLGKRVFIDPSALVIGDVSVSDDVSIWPMTVVRGDMHSIRIGSRTSIQDASVLHITHAGPYNPGGWPLSIGEDCTVGHKATLHGCSIGNRVLIGIGSIVLDGANIEDDVVVGANTLVPPGKTLKSGYLYLGSPARQIRKLSSQEMEYFIYSAANYVKLKDQHIADLNGA